MPGRTPTEAFIEFIAPVRQALGFIAAGRLVFGGDNRGFLVGQPEKVSFNDGDPVRLRSSLAGSIFLELTLRVETIHIAFGPEPYDCRLVGYWYALSTSANREILAFHWTPDMIGTQRSFPHMHVGSVVSGAGEVASDRFHKLHIPTGYVSVPALVRFAIQEFGVSVRTGIGTKAALRELDHLDPLG
jgi:hypothetical protein